MQKPTRTMNEIHSTTPGTIAPVTKVHLSLHVADLQRSIAFYSAFFGLAPHKVRPGYANFDVANPPLKLALTEKSSAPVPGALDHLGLLVPRTADVHVAKARLEAAGLATVEEMETTCCYAKQDKIWVRDPDNNAWEVYALTDDMLEDSSASAGDAGGCCRD